MNKQTIVIAVVLLLVAASGYYFVNSSSEQSTPNIENQEQSESTNDAPSLSDRLQGRGSLMSFLGLGRTVRSTYSHSDTEANVTSEGEFFYDGTSEKFRVDSTTKDDSGTYIMHMINDGEFAYLWSEGEDEPFAMKMSADVHSEANAQEFAGPTDDSNRQVSVDAEVEYDCDSWRVDSSKFVPPSDVVFTDMAAMMKEMMEGMPEGFELPAGFPGQ